MKKISSAIIITKRTEIINFVSFASRKLRLNLFVTIIYSTPDARATINEEITILNTAKFFGLKELKSSSDCSFSADLSE